MSAKTRPAPRRERPRTGERVPLQLVLWPAERDLIDQASALARLPGIRRSMAGYVRHVVVAAARLALAGAGLPDPTNGMDDGSTA